MRSYCCWRHSRGMLRRIIITISDNTKIMGFFNFGKKKETKAEEPAPVINKLNSVFTLKFAVPYFQVFDKTNAKLANFPIKVAVGGSVQYRIADPDLCFNNVSLSQMSPEQLEEHVKDGLIAVIKAFINQITTIPVLQFETAIMKLNNAAKEYVVPTFMEEYGISLRTFNMSRISYDTEDLHYAMLQEFSRNAVLNMAEKQESEHQIELNRDRLTIETDNKNLERVDIAIQREKNAVEVEKRSMDIDLKSKDLHLGEDIHARRVSTDNAAKNGTLNVNQSDGLKFDIDDNEFKIDGL